MLEVAQNSINYHIPVQTLDGTVKHLTPFVGT